MRVPFTKGKSSEPFVYKTASYKMKEDKKYNDVDYFSTTKSNLIL